MICYSDMPRQRCPRPQARDSLRSAVERLLAQLLPHAKASASNVARQLAMSTRTLSRRLYDEGVTFVEILEQTRAALARRYLAERDLPVAEIAWLLGYSEVSSFNHAFKRWTGMTPRQFGLTAANESGPARNLSEPGSRPP